MAKVSRRFFLSNMEDPENFYMAIAIRLFYAEYYALDCKEVFTESIDKKPTESSIDRLRLNVSSGYDDFSYIIGNVISVDRSFRKLLDALEPSCALALVRMQLDNLKHIYAETKYPAKVLYRIYEKGDSINQIKIEGKQINPTELVEELDQKYGRIREIWKSHCLYVHPSKRQVNIEISSRFSLSTCKEVPTKKAIRELSLDMVYINKIITTVLFTRLDELVANIKQKQKYKAYLETVKRIK